jgi:hypothetical protein
MPRRPSRRPRAAPARRRQGNPTALPRWPGPFLPALTASERHWPTRAYLQDRRAGRRRRSEAPPSLGARTILHPRAHCKRAALAHSAHSPSGCETRGPQAAERDFRGRGGKFRCDGSILLPAAEYKRRDSCLLDPHERTARDTGCCSRPPMSRAITASTPGFLGTRDGSLTRRWPRPP